MFHQRGFTCDFPPPPLESPAAPPLPPERRPAVSRAATRRLLLRLGTPPPGKRGRGLHRVLFSSLQKVVFESPKREVRIICLRPPLPPPPARGPPGCRPWGWPIPRGWKSRLSSSRAPGRLRPPHWQHPLPPHPRGAIVSSPPDTPTRSCAAGFLHPPCFPLQRSCKNA